MTGRKRGKMPCPPIKGDVVDLIDFFFPCPAREYTWPNTKAPWNIRLPRGRIGASQASSSTLDIVPVFRPPWSPSPSRRHGNPGGWKYDITAIGEVKSLEPQTEIGGSETARGSRLMR